MADVVMYHDVIQMSMAMGIMPVSRAGSTVAVAVVAIMNQPEISCSSSQDGASYGQDRAPRRQSLESHEPRKQQALVQAKKAPEDMLLGGVSTPTRPYLARGLGDIPTLWLLFISCFLGHY